MIWGTFFKRLPLFYLWAAVFLMNMLIYWGDKFAWWVLRYDKKTSFIRKGSCQRTGMCCQALSIELPASWFKRAGIVRVFNAWYRNVNGFQPLRRVGNLLQFNCAYLSKENTCSIYPYRPKICREYPSATLFGHARVHRGCGFWFVEREGTGSFAEALKREEHESDRRDFLQGRHE